MKNFIFSLLYMILSTTSAQVTISLDAEQQYQHIEGFGGFGAKKVWWESGPYHDAEYLSQTINNLGVTFFRTQIYWDGELTNDNNDPNTINVNGFNFGPSSNNGKQFPFLKDLSDRGAKLIATVWTPPTWMKLFDNPERIPDECYNCVTCAPGSDGRKMCGGRLNPEHYDEFAEYLVVYVKTLKEKTGIDLYAISIQNEPFFANPFESNVVMPDEYADILRVVGQRFKTEGLSTKFFGPEHMAEWSWGWQAKYVQEILGDPETKPLLDIYAVHSYVDGVAADYGSAEGWTQLHQNITVAHDKPLWMTETSDFQLKDFDLVMSMAKSLYLALKFGRISGWVYWSMTDAVINNNQLTPLGYAFKNYYKYIRPGSIMIKAESNDPSVLTVSFIHPGNSDLTIIVINQGNEIKNVSFTSPPEYNDFTLYRTSENENCVEIGIIENTTNITLPPASISTITTIEGAGVVGIEENNDPGFSVYPNPANNKLIVNISGTKPASSITITDHLGRKMASGSSDRVTEFDTNSWPGGIYYVTIKHKADSITYKVVVKK